MKKILFILVTMLLPLVAWADYSGDCGSGLTYTLDEATGVLKISKTGEGTGIMTNWDFLRIKTPWYKDRGIIKTVILEDGVTSIGDDAFRGCNGLTSVTIPNSVTSIGDAVFQNCIGLASVTIPNSVTSIGRGAFYGCSELKSVTIPGSVTEIKPEVFYDCPYLEQVVFENGADELRLDLYEKIFDSSIKKLYLGRNVCPNIDNPSRNFIPFGGINTLTKLTIGSAVTSFDPIFFNECYNLETLIIEDGTEDLTIGDVGRVNFTFSSTQIQSLYLGRNVKGMVAPFEISYPFILTIGKNVTSLFGLAYCTGLSTVEIPDNIEKIEENAFVGCSSLTKISIPNTVKEIGGSAFRGCSGLASITLPENLETISWSLFDGCSNLTTVNIPNGVADIGGWAFNDCSKLNSLTIPSSVKSIGIRAFYGCTSLSIVTVPKSVTDIYNWAFYGCKNLTEVIFENGEEPLEFWGADSNNEAFKESSLSKIFVGRNIGYTKSHPNRKSPLANLESLKDITIDINLSNGSAFKGSNIESVTITSNVTNISTSALRDFTGLKYVTIEDSEIILDCEEGGNFYHCPLEKVYIGRNISYSYESPFRYNRDGLKTLVLSDNVTEIGEGLFSGLRGLTSLTLSKNLKTIGKQAFYGCEGLTSVYIPNSVIEIGKDAFDLTRGLTSFTIEDGTEKLSISNNFLNSPLNEVYLGRNITYPDGQSPFSLLESLKIIKIGKEVDNINDRAFVGCQNLKDVISYAVNVPATGQNVFTESYLSDAKLHVLDVAYNNYRVKYPWNRFKNYILIDENGNETPAPSITGNEGDASGDNVVNAADIVEIVSYMMGFPSQSFFFNNADINGDGIINVSDIIAISNIILGAK